MSTKSLTVTSQSANLNGRMTVFSTTVVCPEEPWSLYVTTRTPDTSAALEEALFTVRLPGGGNFSFTAQNVANMQRIVQNARKELMDYASNGFTDPQDESEVLDSIKELDMILSLFSK